MRHAGRVRSRPWLARRSLQRPKPWPPLIYPWIEAVYLFGSRAKGNARPSSDIDLAILTSPSGAPTDRLEAEAELARFVEDRVGIPVDVVLIRRDLSPGLLSDIFSVETILYARDWERAHRVACQARAEYRDLLPRLERAFRRVQRQIEELANALNPS